jgi:hypothetical protein
MGGWIWDVLDRVEFGLKLQRRISFHQLGDRQATFPVRLPRSRGLLPTARLLRRSGTPILQPASYGYWVPFILPSSLLPFCYLQSHALSHTTLER